MASSDNLESPEEMQQNDPYAIQIWKLFRDTKARIPNHERMDNLAWRMMAMNLKRREQERDKYVTLTS